MAPSRIVGIAAPASSSGAARASTCSRASRAASCTASPMIVVERLALVPQSYGVTDVSGAATTTDANGTPSVSAVIWAGAVRVPWPASTLTGSTSAMPSAVVLTIAEDVLGVPPPSFIAQVRPQQLHRDIR